MNRPKKSLLAVVAILLFLSGCELIGFVVSQEWQSRECGEYDKPPELVEKIPNLGNERRVDEAIVLLEKYAPTRNPDVLFTLAYAYLEKVADAPDDPVRNRRIVEVLTLAALCGQGRAVLYLGGFYRAGVLGLEKDHELGACLKKVYERHRHERALIPGRVWACGLRMESVGQ